MKIAITLLTLSLMLSACGQKGPLIVETKSSNSTQATDQEVTEKKSVLNTQTEETSPTR